MTMHFTTDSERIPLDAREREQQVIRAMQRRAARNPIRDLMWRRPWRAGHSPNWRSVRDTWQWLRAAHDCTDPAVGCSCDGGFRFPRTPGAPDTGRLAMSRVGILVNRTDLCAVLDQRTMHCHLVPGRWDDSGQPCSECAARDRLRAALAGGDR